MEEFNLVKESDVGILVMFYNVLKGGTYSKLWQCSTVSKHTLQLAYNSSLKVCITATLCETNIKFTEVYYLC